MDNFIPELQNHIYASEGFSTTIMSNPRHRCKEEKTAYFFIIPQCSALPQDDARAASDQHQVAVDDPHSPAIGQVAALRNAGDDAAV